MRWKSIFRDRQRSLRYSARLKGVRKAYVVRLHSALALLTVVAILLTIAIVVAMNASVLAGVALVVTVATLAHNVAGLLLGYLAAWALGFDRAIFWTIAIEVGMQNSGLATVLAVKFFSPLAALPGIVFSIGLNITGSLFAALSLRFEGRQETMPETAA